MGTPVTAEGSARQADQFGLIMIKHFASGVRKLPPALSYASACGRFGGGQLVKLTDVPGLSRMSDSVLAEIFTCSRMTALPTASFQISCLGEGKTPFLQSLMMIGKIQLDEHLTF